MIKRSAITTLCGLMVVYQATAFYKKVDNNSLPDDDLEKERALKLKVTKFH
jgi:hypothetical protein